MSAPFSSRNRELWMIDSTEQFSGHDWRAPPGEIAFMKSTSSADDHFSIGCNIGRDASGRTQTPYELQKHLPHARQHQPAAAGSSAARSKPRKIDIGRAFTGNMCAAVNGRRSQLASHDAAAAPLTPPRETMSLPSSARKSYEKVLDREVTALMHKTLLGQELGRSNGGPFAIRF